MNKKVQVFSTEIGGKELKFEVGHFAGQANGVCTLQYGDTVVLATACISKNIREGIDFFPLLVDYDEKLYAAGKIKGSRFIKREGRPSDEAILSGRLVDRSIRPFFNEEIRNDIQTVITILSFDNENDPDVIGLNAASCALAISDISWNGPVAAVRVGRIESSLSDPQTRKFEWVLNPTYEARQKSDLDLVVVGTKDNVAMLEAGANEVSEQVIEEAIEFGMKYVRKIIKHINEIAEKIGKQKKDFDGLVENKLNEQGIRAIENKVKQIVDGKIESIFTANSKEEYQDKVDELYEMINEILKQDNDVTKDERTMGIKMIEKMLKTQTQKLVLKQCRRVDGRQLNQVRSLSAEAGILPRTHGSGLFSRGETQALSIVTLGSPSAEQTLDTMEETGKKRYMHHYNFPGYSVGEVAPLRGPGRREIGHGALAEKSLLPVLPSKEDFPYTIRVVTEILSSNGSSSQAAVCGSSLALMDAGVPIKKPVAGIAMGVIVNEDNKEDYKILTDIQGIEDSSGGMDFKIAGTKDGITAMQLDIKIDGLTQTMISKTLTQAKEARNQILDVMTKTIAEPRKELSPYAPRIFILHINPEKIRDVIGPGGKVINAIIDATGVAIDIEDSGLVYITAPKSEGAEKAIKWIEDLTKEVKLGEIYKGKVTRLMDFGAFVQVLPNQEGLVHISEMAPFRVDKVADVVKEGDVVPVKVKEIDEQNRINLTFLGTDFDFSKIKRSIGNSFNSHRFNGPRNKFRKPMRNNY